MFQSTRKILVVEDDLDFSVLVKSRLQSHGYDVHVSSSSEDGLLKIKEQKPDLIITDIVLPGMDGFELCTQVKDDKALNLPVIILTSKKNEESRRQGYGCRADAYIAKSSLDSMLVPEIKRILSQGKESYLATIVDDSDDAIIGKTLEGIVTSWNGAAERMYGYLAHEVIGKTIETLFPLDRKREFSDIFNKLRVGKRIKNFETICQKKNGELIDVSLTISPIKVEHGQLIGVSMIARDVTKQKKTQQQLRQLTHSLTLEKAKLEQVLGIEEGLHRLLDVNRLVDFVVQKSCEVLEARRCSIMFYDPDAQELSLRGYRGIDKGKKNIVGKRIKLGEPIAGLVALSGQSVLVKDIEQQGPFCRPNRDGYKSKSFMSVPIKIDNHLLGVINVADKKSQDSNEFSLSDLKILNMIVRQVAVALESARLYRELNYLSMIDPLTNLYNYRYFTKYLDYEIFRAKRYGRDLSLIMIDVDDFKSYNDSFGHVEGDQLLKEISMAMRRSVRNVDVVCRYAGDEFIIILPETDEASARNVAKKIDKNIESLYLKRPVTVSMSTALYQGGMDRLDFVRKADALLYGIKKAKKAE